MPIHDWTRVDAGIFHHFHQVWVVEMAKVLNAGVLPEGYYALVEQPTGRATPDLLALGLSGGSESNGAGPPADGPAGLAVADAPPRVRFREQAGESAVRKPRAVVVRHVSGDRVVAMVEVVSPSNKSGGGRLTDFADKVAALIRAGVHMLILDLLPSGPRDPEGIHPEIWSAFAATPFALPAGTPLTLAAYAAGPFPEAFVEPVAVGGELPDMPLFLTPETYVNVPLAATYRAAWETVPRHLKQVLAG